MNHETYCRCRQCDPAPEDEFEKWVKDTRMKRLRVPLWVASIVLRGAGLVMTVGGVLFFVWRVAAVPKVGVDTPVRAAVTGVVITVLGILLGAWVSNGNYWRIGRGW